jgi:hypothetical protein
MLRYVIGILFTCAVVHSAEAQRSLRFQNSYFLTGQPLFGIGYQHETNAAWQFGLTIEAGRYAHRASDQLNTVRTSYSFGGVALLPEVRHYLFRDTEESHPRGLFIAAFGHLRGMSEYSAPELGNQAEVRRGASIGGGFSAGYRTACGEIPFYFEALIGYGRAHARWRTPTNFEELRSRAVSYDNATTLFRLELAVGYVIGSGMVD